MGSRILFQISTGYLELLSIGLLLHMVYLGGVGAGGGGCSFANDNFRLIYISICLFYADLHPTYQYKIDVVAENQVGRSNHGEFVLEGLKFGEKIYFVMEVFLCKHSLILFGHPFVEDGFTLINTFGAQR